MALNRISNPNLYRAYLVMELLRSTGEKRVPHAVVLDILLGGIP